MQVTNIDVGVLNALKAYKVESGMKDADAARWAAAKLKDGVKVVQDSITKSSRNLDLAVQDAFVELKKWSRKGS